MRLIDADALMEQIRLLANRTSLGEITLPSIGGLEIVGLIIKAPAIDAVPVVRCKDCRHNYGFTHNLCCSDIVCDYHMSDGFEENDFCSYGARMDGDQHDSC